MAEDRNSPGEGTAKRLSRRLDRAELTRQAMPGGGEVFRGKLASRALDALGARAMTMDQTIIVADDFNASRPEDQALYAHEQYHVEHGDGHGGGGGSNYRDAEEIAARAAEAMVFHRAMDGGYEAGFRPGSNGAAPKPGNAEAGGRSLGAGTESDPQGNEDPDAGRGYVALAGQGYSHQDIVVLLGQKVVTAIQEQGDSRSARQGDKKGWT